jgi:iron complex transport system substrate-binding protein
MIRRRGRRAAGGLLTLLGLTLAAGAAHGGAAAPQVVDDAGLAVRLSGPAARIVSLAPGITEMLFDIGAGAQVIAASEYSDTPVAARVLPRVARAQGIDLEAIAALKPDLIVAWGSGYAPALLDALRRLEVPVYVFEPRTLEAIAGSMIRLGILTGAAVAPQRAAQYSARLQSLRARYEQRAPVRVFYQVWAQPIMTLSGRHVASEVLRLCGARNVFADVAPLVATVDAESVIATRPQLIVTSEPGGVDQGALAFWRRYPDLPAVAQGQLYTLDADEMDRQTARVLDAAEKLCADVEQARQRFAN